MANTSRSTYSVLIATLVVTCVVLVGRAIALPQQPAVSKLAAAMQAPPDVKAPPADADKSKSGLASKVITAGTGTEHPTADDRVTVNYTGWTTDGKMFDSSVVRGKPSTFALGSVLPGWTEGVQLMVVGEKRRMWVPEKLAFKGASGRPKGMVVFDIELVDIVPAPRTPPDVAAPPQDAVKERSGLFSKVIKPGTGTEHPTSSSTVTVDYTGWTTDGKMFDSSVVRGQPAQFPLDRVIAGWTEGLQLMTQGEVRRLWIPEDLAYRGEDGKPKGMLVFDVELISFQR
jgi:FKBP-type peptidyl-prolyl cis-trans isomerase